MVGIDTPSERILEFLLYRISCSYFTVHPVRINILELLTKQFGFPHTNSLVLSTSLVPSVFIHYSCNSSRNIKHSCYVLLCILKYHVTNWVLSIHRQTHWNISKGLIEPDFHLQTPCYSFYKVCSSIKCMITTLAVPMYFLLNSKCWLLPLKCLAALHISGPPIGIYAFNWTWRLSSQ